MFRTSREFRNHSENLAAVRQGLTQIERAHKQAIRNNDQPAIQTLAQLHMLMLGATAEAHLRKLVTDPNGFNDRERQIIWRAGSQTDRWLESVELAFRRHYQVLMHLPVDEKSVDVAIFLRYQQVRTLLLTDLRPIIEDRNKTAHAQWAWHLKSHKENEFSGAAPDPLNYREIESRNRLINLIGDLVHLLVVSEPAFDKHYTALMQRLDEARVGLDGSDYEDFAASLRATKKHTK